ncbi:hypothetical protein OG474_17890 [Kribbella sp. NBC_01505]|uniref:hypothetical protein n=1 Tax=Kribbella sp. NBC_01505 TaxID=2903580 RepID=UPI00386E7234
MTGLELHIFIALDDVRGDLVDVYAAVRSELLHLPNYAVKAFGERLDRHGVEPGFVAVVAYVGGVAVRYADANTIERGGRRRKGLRALRVMGIRRSERASNPPLPLS